MTEEWKAIACVFCGKEAKIIEEVGKLWVHCSKCKSKNELSIAYIVATLKALNARANEWHEDVYCYRAKDSGHIGGSRHPIMLHALLADYWRERRFYKEVNGKVEFIRSERIEDE